MNTATCFELKIVDLFRFADGRTVLVGPVEGEAKFIRPGKCALLIDGVPKVMIQIEGEMMPDRGSPGGLPIRFDSRRILSGSKTVVHVGVSIAIHG